MQWSEMWSKGGYTAKTWGHQERRYYRLHSLSGDSSPYALSSKNEGKDKILILALGVDADFVFCNLDHLIILVMNRGKENSNVGFFISNFTFNVWFWGELVCSPRDK